MLTQPRRHSNAMPVVSEANRARARKRAPERITVAANVVTDKAHHLHGVS
ncbi:MAG: hypothetical protein ABR936_07230 [Bacteroidota bacterium]